MAIDKGSTTPLYVQIRENLRNSIASGQLAIGDRLPAVTAFATDKGVTVATVRRALKDLIDEGLIHTHVGRGTFVGKNTNKPVANKTFVSNPPQELVPQNMPREGLHKMSAEVLPKCSA